MLFNKSKKDLKISKKVKKQLIAEEKKVKGTGLESQFYLESMNRARNRNIKRRKLSRVSRKINYRQKKGKAINKGLYKKVA